MQVSFANCKERSGWLGWALMRGNVAAMQVENVIPLGVIFTNSG
jgi:hypothetical protein